MTCSVSFTGRPSTSRHTSITPSTTLDPGEASPNLNSTIKTKRVYGAPPISQKSLSRCSAGLRSDQPHSRIMDGRGCVWYGQTWKPGSFIEWVYKPVTGLKTGFVSGLAGTVALFFFFFF